jgi:pimeloyl-ACP methyl ester carboxylesterase
MNTAVTTAAVTPRSRYLTCEGREIHFMDWEPEAPTGQVVVAWHGLARTGRDMDPLAAHLAAQGWRVICPDTIGRGLSEWSPKPEAEYCLDFYSRIATALVDQLAIKRFHWVGTSMGGAIGMVCAAGPLHGRIERLVLNDIGPKLAEAAVQRIRSYAGNPAAFATVSELEQYFRTVYKPYGYLSDTQWRLLTESSARRLPDGRVTPHYDPAMVMQFSHHPADLRPHRRARAVPARCGLRPAAGRYGRSHARPRAARAGGDDCRLRPCAGAQRAGAVRSGAAVSGRALSLAAKAARGSTNMAAVVPQEQRHVF